MFTRCSHGRDVNNRRRCHQEHSVNMGHFGDISVDVMYCHHIGVIMATILENMDLRVIEA